jgi:hypothetical protein
VEILTVQLGYCTNVHAGADLEQTRANLDRHARAVKQRVSPRQPLGIGLWLSAAAARALRQGPPLDAFRDWLGEAGLLPYTVNGFPYYDFHQKVVKHQVYLPTWRDPARLEFTLDLVHILDALLPPGVEGSISTLPLAWGEPRATAAQLEEHAASLRRVAGELERLEKEKGRLIHLCLEPEPGCVLQRSTDIVRFFEEHLLRAEDEATLRRYLRVCHDVCHAAVMFEGQAEVLARYRRAGIRVGKVQVSSAVRLPLDDTPPAERAAALDQLAGFHEERYLHQTMVRATLGGEPVFYEDLGPALAGADRANLAGEWRVHFHVPIYVDRFGRLEATKDDILECLRETRNDQVPHFEVETYAWTVLPPELRQVELAAGIADEIHWLRGVWQVEGYSPRTGA